jgi:hypothetical protein
MQAALESNFRFVIAYQKRLQRVQNSFQRMNGALLLEYSRLANLINEREEKIELLLDARKDMLLRKTA